MSKLIHWKSEEIRRVLEVAYTQGMFFADRMATAGLNADEQGLLKTHSAEKASGALIARIESILEQPDRNSAEVAAP